MNISSLLNNVICKKLFASKKKRFLFQKMSYNSLTFGVVRKEKRSNFIYQETMELVKILRDCLILEMRTQVFKIQLLIL